MTFGNDDLLAKSALITMALFVGIAAGVMALAFALYAYPLVVSAVGAVTAFILMWLVVYGWLAGRREASK